MNRPNYINVFAKLFGNSSKIIINEMTTPTQEYKTASIRDIIGRTLLKFLYPKCDMCIPNSQNAGYELNTFFKIPNSKIKTIHNPLNLKIIYKLKQDKINIDDNSFNFITIGRLDKGKNHQLLIKAMQNINAKLYIIGDGILKNELKNQIKKLNLENKIFLLGRQKNPYKFLRYSDCFVFSSLYEGFPNVLLEALACELPIISTDCPSGPREILAPDTNFTKQINDIEIAKYGILTPVGDTEKMTKAMNRIKNNQPLRENYKNKASFRAKDFEVDKIMSQWLDVLNQI